jgi:alcohol dehydrogenase (cytochrome c)
MMSRGSSACRPTLARPANAVVAVPVRLLFAAVAAAFLLSPSASTAAPAGDGYFTESQRASGGKLYAQHCATCHGRTLEGGTASALVGRYFVDKWNRAPRKADDLHHIISSSMPRPDAGSLEARAYLDIVAFILSRNGLVAGSRPLQLEALAAIEMTGAGTDEQVRLAPIRFIRGPGDGRPRGTGPTAAELLATGAGDDWLYHTGNYRGTRYSPLDQITRENVADLRVACLYQVGGDETFVTGPIVHDGVMYLTTTTRTIALAAGTCRERWVHTWEPQDDMVWPLNRGVAIQDGYVVRGTADGYLLALDALDGALLWARQVAKPAEGETITMPPVIFDDRIIIGPAGSENKIQGWVGAFSLADGTPLWRFHTVPREGEAGTETWENRDDLPVGGGAVWTPLSLDVERGQIYIPVTNPAPDFAAHLRRGDNLYTNSIVALDARSGELQWYRQLVPNDDKDWDLTQVSPVYDTEIDGERRSLVTTAGKDGVVRVLDRTTAQTVFETRLGVRINDDKPITFEGTRYCPGVLGGVQWNGPTLHPASNQLFITMVNWCTTARLVEDVRFIPGENYLGGEVELDDEATGSLTAIDASTGAVAWQYDSPEPMVAATLATAGGVLFAGELSGDLIAFDVRDGAELYRFHTGGSMAGGLVSYAVDGEQHIATVSGRGSFWFGGEGSPTLVVLRR